MAMNCSAYHDWLEPPSQEVPWHSVAAEIADLNFNIVTGKLNKRMKSCNQAIPWDPKVSGYTI